MKKTLGDYIVLLISVFGSLASIIAIGLYFAPYLDNQGVVGVFFLGIITLFFIGYSFFLISKYRKRIRYSDIFGELNVGFSELHQIDRHDAPSIELIIQKLGFLCDNLSTAFSLINDRKIGVCIKVLTFKGRRPMVTTLVRDRYSKSKNRKTGTADNIEHYIELNSDFQFIWDNIDSQNVEKSYYHEKHLPTCKDYKNTRLNSNWKSKTTKWGILDNFIRRKLWPLPYRSTLVVPIVPLVANEQNQKAIRGFLCLDSTSEGQFNPSVDVDILKGISDGLYNKIDKVNTLIKRNDED